MYFTLSGFKNWTKTVHFLKPVVYLLIANTRTKPLFGLLARLISSQLCRLLNHRRWR
jgi:hypothetical protein